MQKSAKHTIGTFGKGISIRIKRSQHYNLAYMCFKLSGLLKHDIMDLINLAYSSVFVLTIISTSQVEITFDPLFP